MKDQDRNSGRNRPPLTEDQKAGGPSGDGENRNQDAENRLTRLAATNRQLKRKIFDLYTIFEISRNFNAVLNYQTLLDSFILTSLAQVGASRAAIFLKSDPKSEGYVMTKQKGSGEFPDPDLSFRSDSALVSYLTKLNRPVPSEELIKDIASESERKILRCFESGLVVPLIFQNRLSGIFAIADKLSGRGFQMDDVEFLSILGNQISVAIENVRLYEAERMATQQLRAAQQQLVLSERLAALGDFSAKVAHEINNPLGIIKNYLLLIQRSSAENSSADEYTNIIRQEIDRIAGIVKELLEFHRPKGVNFKELDLIKVIENVILLMDLKLSSCKIELIRDYAPEPVLIQGVADNLKQVFINLMINACDAMPEGGKVKISVDSSSANKVNIRFSDTGPGIPTDIIPRIFEPFFTTKEEGKGTGLGLPVCYGIIKRHGGTIDFHNLDTGGCFALTLPVRAENNNNGK